MSKFNNECVKGFLHADGMKLVNGDGEEVILRGMGAGNWTNPEGFMIGAPGGMGAAFGAHDLVLPGRFERGRTMYTTMVELCGRDYADEFQDRWYEAHLQEGDIKLMAEMGYNSVRLPIGSRMLLREGPGIVFNERLLKHLDNIMDWCEKYRIYAILDLHAAPGGQSGIPCDDGLDNKPHFFEEPESRERGLIIWETLAERYADRWIVGGYDLLNEPLSTLDYYQRWDLLKDFYDECVARIRKVDKNHMVNLEGTLTSSTLGIFDHDYDPECHNWAIHMHEYGFTGDVAELYPVLYTARKLNVPIWYGEGGGGNEANTVFYEMLAYFGIGWNQWVWKAAGNPNRPSNGPTSYMNPEGFEKIQDYIGKGGPRPSYEECMKIFDQVLENLKVENCRINYEGAKYNLRHPGITIPAAGYAFGYPCDDLFSNNVYDGNPWAYRLEDHTRLILKDGIIPETQHQKTMASRFAEGMGGMMFRKSALNELLLELRENEYTTYVIREVKEVSEVSLKARVCEDAVIEVNINGEVCEVKAPAGDFADIVLGSVKPAEEGKVRITVKAGIVQIESITFA
ncbi:MAG: cellulase family glycosylhydrolase [Lachnospiraceae bacterium]|nr:cellulase family glycosylhydrolase [Lachnospiraceae bacterium]